MKRENMDQCLVKARTRTSSDFMFAIHAIATSSYTINLHYKRKFCIELVDRKSVV